MAPFIFVLVVALSTTAVCQPISDQPPRFTQEADDTVVYQTDASGRPNTLTLSCGTAGDPAPTVTWFRSGVQVDNSLVLESGTLSIVNITEGQSASREGIPYYCTATNTLGTIRSRTVKVFYAFFDGINSPSGHMSINVTLGRDVALLCDVAAAKPPPVIEWLDDSGVIADGVRYLSGGRYLLLRSLKTEQINKTYRCRVTNAFIHSTIESDGNYTLNNLGSNFPDRLVVYKELETEVTAAVGDTAEFSFVAATNLDSTFILQYQIDGSTSQIGTSGPLGTIENVQLPAMGIDTSYNVTLTIAASFGQMMFTSILTVIEPAVISNASENDLDQFVGDPLSFFCMVSGAPAPDVVWYFNGERLTPSDRLTINGGTIDIPSTTAAHSGMYQCFVSNIANTVHAAIALQVREPEPPVVTHLSPGQDRCREEPTYPMAVGEPLTLSVTVTANPCPEVEWRLNGTTLGSTNTYTINSCGDFTAPQLGFGSYNFTITISDISDSTSGHYTATFTNRAGNATSHSMFVTPEVPARVVGVQIQDSMCLQDNMNKTVFCEVEGYPFPEINFVKDNIPLEEMAGRVTVNDCGIVFLARVVSSDEGLYSCTAENVVNGEMIQSTSDTVMLQYCTQVQIVSLIALNSSLGEGETIFLTCTISGTPTPSIVWTKNDVVLTNTSRITVTTTELESQLQITSAALEDNGDYTCRASSITGEASRQVSIEVSESEGGTPTIDPGTGDSQLILPIAVAGGVGSLVLGIVIITTAIIVIVCLRRRKKAKLASSSNDDHFYDVIPYDNPAGYYGLRKNPSYDLATATSTRTQNLSGLHTSDQLPELASDESKTKTATELGLLPMKTPNHEHSQTNHTDTPLQIHLDTIKPIQAPEGGPATETSNQRNSSDEAETETGNDSDKHVNTSSTYPGDGIKRNKTNGISEHDPTGSVSYDNKYFNSYEQCGDKYEHLRSYEQASDQYDRMQNYEQRGDAYEEAQQYETRGGGYDRVQQYEKPCEGYDRVQQYEKPCEGYDRIQQYEKPCEGYDRIQQYELATIRNSPVNINTA